MPNIFRKAKVRAPGYSWFDLSHENKFTFPIGGLTPILNAHLFPGDRFVVGKEHLIRFMPMLAPVYQRFDVRFDTAFIPERIIWKNTKEFYRGGKDGATDYTRPTIPLFDLIKIFWCLGWTNDQHTSTSYTSINFLQGTLLDYMGIPTFDFLQDADTSTPISFSGALDTFMAQHGELMLTPVDLLPFFSYQAMFREYYRDQFVDENSSDDTSLSTSYAKYLPEIDPDDFLALAYPSDIDLSNENLTALQASMWGSLLKYRNVRFPKDYFTSAFPTPQLGNPVNIPISSTLTVDGRAVGKYSAVYASTFNLSRLKDKSGNLYPATSAGVDYDLNIVNSGTIPDLRRANRMQEYNEKSLLGGNRFIDWILAHFGVHSSDARLDRPELISRSKSAVTISDVTQSSPDAYGSSSASQPLGSLAGQGISVSGDRLCDYAAEEPGWLQVYISVVPRASYFQGISKELFKTDRFDYLIPEFAEIGEQPILGKELHPDGEDNVFGYTERYAEYKYMPSEIHGDFRYSLSYWHDARMFADCPNLNSNFLEVNENLNDLSRIFSYTQGNYSNDTDNYHLLAAVYFDIKAYRALPEFPRYQM